MRSTEDGRRDSCSCMCFPNGIVPLVMAQILLITSVTMSWAVMLDCNFVTADIDPGAIGLLEDTDKNGELTARRGLGFFNHEMADGSCRWEQNTSGDEFEDYHDDYHDWLGSDWEVPRHLGLTAASAGTLVLVWALIFSCVAHIRCLRYFVGGILIFLLCPFQFATLSLLNSDFCKEHNCAKNAGYRISIATGILYFFAGLMFFFMKDYSVKERVDNATDGKQTENQQEERKYHNDEESGDNQVRASEEVSAQVY